MGKLIVFEGTDGSGKSTQFELLAKRLEAEQTGFQRLRFPQYEEPSSALIRMYLGGAFGDDPEAVKASLRAMKSRLGVYACWGNHDVSERLFSGFSTKRLENTLRGEEMEQFVRESGMTMLADEVRLIDDSFYVIGRKDYENAGDGTARRKSLGELMAGIDTDRLVISLEHEPRFLRQNADAGVDVMLCGHTHDGQFFPLNIAIRTAWENPAGLKTVGRMTSVVTSGVGVYGPDMRIGTDADISVVDIQFAP